MIVSSDVEAALENRATVPGANRIRHEVLRAERLRNGGKVAVTEIDDVGALASALFDFSRPTV